MLVENIVQVFQRMCRVPRAVPFAAQPVSASNCCTTFPSNTLRTRSLHNAEPVQSAWDPDVLAGLNRVILTRPQTEIAVAFLFCKETAAWPLDRWDKSVFG